MFFFILFRDEKYKQQLLIIVEFCRYNIPLEVTGGDEKFLWSSSDHSIGVVSQSGMVRTHSKGHFEVSAAMQKNHYNRQTAK